MRLTKTLAKVSAKFRSHRQSHRHQIPANTLAKTFPLRNVESLVIPVVGAAYIEEGTIAASFAERFYPGLKEIVIVTDCPEEMFSKLPTLAVVKRLNVDCLIPRSHTYSSIYRSRLIKILAPLQASHEHILMTDSDLNLMQAFQIPFGDNYLMGSFRKGKMISKVYRSGAKLMPSALRGTYRAHLWDHLNGAFLAATRTTWERLSPNWLADYIGIWNKLPDNQPPTDQLALCATLDQLDIATVDLGDWVNWPVAKKIGGQASRIPREVIGAHGGFPISEWYRYFEDQNCELKFIDPEEMGTCRYKTDQERSENA